MAELFYKTQRKEEHYRTCWNIYPKILKKVNVLPSDIVLDVGCGIGELSKHIKTNNLFGLDNNELAVKKARKNGNYFDVKVGDINHLPYKDNTFDKTFCIEVLEYLDDPYPALEELLRVTNGEVIISSANFKWYELKSNFSLKWMKQLVGQLKRSPLMIDKKELQRMAFALNCKLKIFYVSNRFNWLRSLFGNHLASEVVGVFSK